MAYFVAITINARAGEVNILPTKIVLEIEAMNGNGTVQVINANSQTSIGNITYALCDIDAMIALMASSNAGYEFTCWKGNDVNYPYNSIPADYNNPLQFTLYSDAAFIQLSQTAWLDTVKLKAFFREASVCNISYPISNHGFFVTAVDALGSQLELDSSTVPPTFRYNQIFKDNIISFDWPWNDISFHIDQNNTVKNLSGVQAIQITYKSSHLWSMTLPFDAKLMSEGGNHSIDLPITTYLNPADLSPSGMYTFTAYIDEFTWPLWYTDHTIALQIDSVKQISFWLTENAEASAYKGDFIIESFKLCGIGSPVENLTLSSYDVTLHCGQSNAILPLNISNANPATCSYKWSPATGLNSTTVQNPIANPMTTTTYQVTVTSSTGQTATSSVVVNIDAKLGYDMGNDYILCETPVVISAGEGFNSYLWSTGESTSSIITSQPGRYTVTVTALSGCSAVDFVQVYKVNCKDTIVSLEVLQQKSITDTIFAPILETCAIDYELGIDSVYIQSVQQFDVHVAEIVWAVWQGGVKHELINQVSFEKTGNNIIWQTINCNAKQKSNTSFTFVGVYNFMTTNLEKEITSSFSSYPNPANNKIVIEFSNQMVYTDIQIINTLGQTIFTQQKDHLSQHSCSIDISTYSKGLYFIKVGQDVQKFIKQ